MQVQSQKNKYNLFPTADGSFSYLNTEYDEAYHSEHGAYSEALHKHVLASKILESKLNKIRILDVCFGLGYNSGVAIEKLLELNPDCRIEIIGLENDSQIIELIKDLEIPDSISNYRAAHQMLVMSLDNPKSNPSIEILIGDAREQIKSLESNYFDAVFFDPFSPRKCPELWQLDFIREVVRCSKPGAYITTYSTARIAKDNFSATGCSLEEGPKLGRRNGGVLARKLC